MAPRQWAGRTVQDGETAAQVEGRKEGRKENRCGERASRRPEGGRRRSGAKARICEAVEKFTRFDGDVWRLCVRDLLSSEVEARSLRLLATSPPRFLRRGSDNRALYRSAGRDTGVFRSIGRVDDVGRAWTDGNNWFENLANRSGPF